MKKTTTTKKVAPKNKIVIKDVRTYETKEIIPNGYNEFGVCFACNGGREDCLHNNLIQDGFKTICATCRKEMN